MLAIFRQSLARSRGQILGWGICLAILAAYLMSFYDTLAGQREQLQQLLSGYPPELMAFFGDSSDMATASGFLEVEFFSYMPLVIGVFAVLAGSGMTSADEENGTLDLVLAHPLSRAALFFGPLLGLVATTLGILAVSWGGFIIGLRWTSMDVSAAELALPFVSLAATLLLFAALSLLMSMVLPSRRLAAMVGGITLVASFFITSLARIDENLEPLARFSPLDYYQSGDALLGLNWEWLLGLVTAAAVFALLAWWRFERRDIRVAGEGSWGLRLRRGRRPRDAL
ncbi:MAG: ABC transporter permease subunit [Chloroflexota bacterium]